MRVSSDKNDRGHIPDPWNYRVTIDGLPLGGVVTADEEVGYALAVVHDRETGEPLRVAGYASLPLTERVEGKVVVTKIGPLKP